MPKTVQRKLLQKMDADLYSSSDSGSDTEPYDADGPINIEEHKANAPTVGTKRKAPTQGPQFFGQPAEQAPLAAEAEGNKPSKLLRRTGFCRPLVPINANDDVQHEEGKNPNGVLHHISPNAN